MRMNWELKQVSHSLVCVVLSLSLSLGGVPVQAFAEATGVDGAYDAQAGGVAATAEDDGVSEAAERSEGTPTEGDQGADHDNTGLGPAALSVRDDAIESGVAREAADEVVPAEETVEVLPQDRVRALFEASLDAIARAAEGDDGSALARAYGGSPDSPKAAGVFAAIASELGLECAIAESEEGDATWNLVEVDGLWYHVDVRSATEQAREGIGYDELLAGWLLVGDETASNSPWERSRWDLLGAENDAVDLPVAEESYLWPADESSDSKALDEPVVDESSSANDEYLEEAHSTPESMAEEPLNSNEAETELMEEDASPYSDDEQIDAREESPEDMGDDQSETAIGTDLQSPVVTEQTDDGLDAESVSPEEQEDTFLSTQADGYCSRNISETPVTQSAGSSSSGTLPPAATVYVGKQYYLNMQVTDNVKVSKAVLTVTPPNSSPYTYTFSINNYIRWANYPCSFNSAGILTFSWYLEYVGGGSNTYTNSVTVNKNPSKLTVTDYVGTYDGSGHSLSCSVSGPSSYTLYYSTETALNESNFATYGSTTRPSISKTGYHEVFVFMYDRSGKYENASASGHVVIKPRLNVSDTQFTYDGSAHGPKIECSGSKLYYRTSGAFPADIDTIMLANKLRLGKTTAAQNGLSETLPTITNAGSLTVYYMAVPQGVPYMSSRLNPGDTSRDVLATGSATVSISRASLSNATVRVSNGTYNGSTFTPVITVTMAGRTLTQNVDYSVVLPSNRVNADTYTVTVTGMGNYVGSKSASFTINPKAISSCSAVLSPTSYAYDGTQKTPALTVKDGSLVLAEGTQYTASWPSGRIDAGTYTVTVTGKGNYNGTTTVSFRITPKDVSFCTITVSPSSYAYDGTQKSPTVTVRDGSTTLEAGTHYTLKEPSGRTDAGTYTYTVTGKGNYAGITTAYLTISKAAPTLKFASASVSKKDTDAPFTNALTKTTDGAVTFSSSDAAVATVDPSTGKVTIKGAGKATITAKAAAGKNYKAGSASYALTVAKTYEVTYDANGGTGTPSPQTKVEGVALKLSGAKPTKSFLVRYNASGGSVSPASKSVACTFTGWNTRKDGKGASYAAGGSYDANAGATLYAQWANPKAGALAAPTRSGYDFAGWYTSATGGSRVTASTVLTANMTVYARWSAQGDPYDMGDETYSFKNYRDNKSPLGHCFGMSMTSAGYHLGLLDIRRIGGNASTPLYGFGLTFLVDLPICHYQGVQGDIRDGSTVAGGTYYLHGYHDIDSDWKAVVNYVKSHKYDGTGELQIGYRKGLGGHAINFLRYESVGGQDRIYAYDNNCPNQETYFYRDSRGNVLQAPYQTFSGAIDCIALRDVRTYFRYAGDFDATHVLYMDRDAAKVPGYNYTYMEGGLDGVDYVMYEIPADVDSVTIVPSKDNADFIYMDTEYSFGEVTDSTRGELRFATMKEGAVVEEEDFRIYEDKKPAGDRFPDVKKGSWYYAVVNRAAELGLVGGYADGRFGPDDNITRGQVAVILWRMAGQPEAGAAAKSFSDVAAGKYYYDAVRWASSAGVVSGYANGTFGPDNKVTREQLAVMLANYARRVGGLEVKGSKADFASMRDASSVASYAQPAVGWCFRNKILSGSDGNVLPKGDATRAQAAKMLVFLYDMVK